MGIITLLTDFGTRDEYVGVMKGVILGVNPEAVVVDISHRVDAHDIRSAGYMLQAAYPYFPLGTVHLVVVDPGVGGAREVIALRVDGHLFLGPDNGVFSQVLSDKKPAEIVRVTDPELFLAPLSHTFHGRDLFAPVAARLAAGLKLQRLGPTIRRRQLTRLTVPKPTLVGAELLVGEIVSVDRFGNLVTNIGASDVASLAGGTDGEELLFIMGGLRIHGLSTSYGSAEGPEPLAVVGSRNVVEIAVNQANAARILKAGVGDRVEVTRRRTDREEADGR